MVAVSNVRVALISHNVMLVGFYHLCLSKMKNCFALIAKFQTSTFGRGHSRVGPSPVY